MDVLATGATSLRFPRDLAFDATGNLIVSSSGPLLSGPGDVLRYSEDLAVTVSLSSPSALPVTVDFSTADNTAVAGSDYSAVSGTVVFDPGVTQRTILVPTIDDGVEESTESFFVNLSADTGAESTLA